MRKIIHIDMDCFYAAVEMRDFPEFKDRALAVGGDEAKRGVLTTCNYLARQYGIRSAMPTHQARKLCPDLVLRPVRMDVYKKESAYIHQIFKQYTDLIEPLSLDEAFLDVSHSSAFSGSATWIAQAIREEIFKSRGLTASAGIAPNKSLAKIASDWNKPNGQKVIHPNDIDEFVKQLPVRKLFGVGPKMEQKLKALNVETCLDLQGVELSTLKIKFGKQGIRLYELSRGIDLREVQSCRTRKSVSVEETFSKNLNCEQALCNQLEPLLNRLKKRLEALAFQPNIHGIFVKLKFSDFKQTTVDKSSKDYNKELFKILLIEGLKRHQKPIRLLGIGVRLENNESGILQLELPLCTRDTSIH